MSTISKAMSDALIALDEGAGSGVIDKGGCLCVSGERLDYHPVTWLRLVTEGLVETGGPNRLAITVEGRGIADDVRKSRSKRMRPEHIPVPRGSARLPMLDEERSS